jgi:DNA-directed RNA polymerase alpha subunit
MREIERRREDIRKESRRLEAEKALRKAEDILREAFELFEDEDNTLEEILDRMEQNSLCHYLSVWKGYY